MVGDVDALDPRYTPARNFNVRGKIRARAGGRSKRCGESQVKQPLTEPEADALEKCHNRFLLQPVASIEFVGVPG
jgi:hypothetical protein